jgi:hypothetical protein
LKGLRWQVLPKQRKGIKIVVMPKAWKPKEFVVPKEGKAKKSSFRRKGKAKEGDCVEENERLKKVFVLQKRLRKMVVRKEKLKPKKSIELKERKN